MSEVAIKLARVRAYLKAHKLDGVVFATRAHWSWLSGGGDAHIVSQTDEAFGALAVTAKGAFLLANTIEMPRLRKEEPVAAFSAKEYPWTTPLREALTLVGWKKGAKGWASDLPMATGLPALPGDFVNECRAQLLDPEVRRYKALGRDCALAMETVARSVQIGDSEHQVEADLARHLLARGVQPHVLLAAFDERLPAYRHPMPTSKRLKRHALLVVCGQRHGLIACLTRCLHFGPLPATLANTHLAVARVEAALWEATVPGATWASAFAAGQAQYKK